MKEKKPNRLDIWVLNAGEGDSIILHNFYEGEDSFALIDSNIYKSDPPALTKLSQLGCTKLNFVLLTHPHADHYRGLPLIMDRYPVDTFYSYPIKIDQAGRLRKLGEIYKKRIAHPTKTIRTAAMDFLLTLKKAKETGEWHELTGPENRIRAKGFSNVELTAVLPLPKNKGEYFQMIENGDDSVFENRNLNKLSVALRLRYAGLELILGADGTVSDWMGHRKEFKKTNETINASIVKLPHHGSKNDCDSSVIDYVFSNKSDHNTIALISATGNKHHPHEEVIQNLQAKGIKPYCTNLSKVCRGNISRINTNKNLEASLNRYVNSSVVDDKNQPCQGDIQLAITEDGKSDIFTEYNHPCPYRGDFDYLIK